MRLEAPAYLRQVRVEEFRRAIRLSWWRLAILGAGLALPAFVVLVAARPNYGFNGMPRFWHVLLLWILLAASFWGLIGVVVPWSLAWSDRAAEIRDGRIRLERFNRRIRPRDVLDCRIEPVEHRPGLYHFSIVYRVFLGRSEWWSIVVDDLHRAELFRAKLLAMKEEATAASG